MVLLKPDLELKSETPGEYYLASLGVGSQRAMTSALNRLAGMASAGLATYTSCPWWLWTPKLTRHIHAQLIRRYKPATVNRHLTALRGVLKAAWHLGLMSERNYREASAVRNAEVPLMPIQGSAPQSKALRKLFAACSGDDARSARDAAIIALLYGCGLRRTELTNLNLEHYDASLACLQVLSGHGANPRLVYPPQGTQEALQAWLAWRGQAAGPLFLRIRRGDHIHPSRISDQSVLLVVKDRAKMAGLGQMTAHELRQGFISNLLEQGASLSAVQHLAGHRSPQSTLRYDRSAERAKEDAARKLLVPYGRTTNSSGT
jgi:site-specific recombinase XerD